MENTNEHHLKIRIVVDADGTERPLTFEHREVTGGEIRELAGVRIEDQLFRLEHGEPTGENIGPDERITIHDGERFVAHPRVIKIIVEVDGLDKGVEFTKHVVTGREIRVGAGAPTTDDLTRIVHEQPVGGNIGLDQRVRIHNLEHFLACPRGTVS